MTAYYYHDRIYPTTLTEDAGNINADYPVAHLLKQAIAQPWRSNTVAAINRAYLDFGASTYIEAVVLVDVNVPAIEAHSGDASATEYPLGNFTAVQNPLTGRYYIIVPIQASRRYVTLTMTVAQMAGLSFGNTGSMYCYASKTDLVRRPRYGLQMSKKQPEIRKEFVNGADLQMDTGSAFTLLDGQFKYTEGDALIPFLDAAGDERVFLDLALAGRPGFAWPMGRDENVSRIRAERFNREFVPFQLKEAV